MTKKCPNCGNMNADIVIMCQYCRYMWCEVSMYDLENKCYHCRLDGKWCETDADFDNCRYGIIIQQYKEIT